jgi:hypothetical protein
LRTSAAIGARCSWTSPFRPMDLPTRRSRRSTECAPNFAATPRGHRFWWTGRAFWELKHLSPPGRQCDCNCEPFPAGKTIRHVNCAAEFKIDLNRTKFDGAECSAWKSWQTRNAEAFRRVQISEDPRSFQNKLFSQSGQSGQYDKPNSYFSCGLSVARSVTCSVASSVVKSGVNSVASPVVNSVVKSNDGRCALSWSAAPAIAVRFRPSFFAR